MFDPWQWYKIDPTAFSICIQSNSVSSFAIAVRNSPVNMEPSPLDIFMYMFFKYIRLLSKICGYDIFVSGFHINWLTRLFYAMMCMASCSSTYTMLFYKTAQMLNAAPTVVLPLQGYVKFFAYCKYFEDNRASLQTVQAIYEATTDSTKSSYGIMLRWSNLIWNITKIFSLIIMMTLFVVLLYPLFVYVIRRDLVPMLPMFVPGIDETTNLGFAILSGLHIMWATQGAVGLMFADMFYSLILLHVWPMVDIFGSMFEQMNTAILARPKLTESLEIKLWLGNIIKTHQEICS